MIFLDRLLHADEDAKTRGALIEVCHRSDFSEAEAFYDLLVEEPDARVREGLVWSLQRTELGVEAIQLALTDPDPTVRMTAARGAAHRTDGELLQAELVQALSDSGDEESVKAAVMEEVRNTFRPEFINRVDDTVVFHRLGREHMAQIAAIQFAVLRVRLAEQDLQIDIDDDALAALVNEGYDPVYGARPLKRVIQKRIENPLAQRILAGEFPPGATINVEENDGDFNFTSR